MFKSPYETQSPEKPSNNELFQKNNPEFTIRESLPPDTVPAYNMVVTGEYMEVSPNHAKPVLVKYVPYESQFMIPGTLEKVAYWRGATVM